MEKMSKTLCAGVTFATTGHEWDAIGWIDNTGDADIAIIATGADVEEPFGGLCPAVYLPAGNSANIAADDCGRGFVAAILAGDYEIIIDPDGDSVEELYTDWGY